MRKHKCKSKRLTNMLQNMSIDDELIESIIDRLLTTNKMVKELLTMSEDDIADLILSRLWHINID